MRHRFFLLLGALALLLVGLQAQGPAPVARALSGGGYDLTWNTYDGGGATFSAGGSFELGGTAGQPEAGEHSGGSYSLGGGFWQPPGSLAFVPIARNEP